MIKIKRMTARFLHLFSIFIISFSSFTPLNLFTQTNDINDENIDKLTVIENLVEKQEKRLERRGEIHPKLLQQGRTLASDTEVSVIVQLSEAPVALEKGKSKLQKRTLSATSKEQIRQKITSQQTEITNKLKQQNISFTQTTAFSETLNAIVLNIKQSDLETLANIPGVVRIDPNEEMRAFGAPTNDGSYAATDGEMNAAMLDSNDHLGIPEVWDSGYTGKGIKVGVVDTGIDYEHPDLKNIYQGGKNFVEHDEDYARKRDDDDPYETSPEDRPDHMPEFDEIGNSFYTSHGTHVAGIIAGAGNNDYEIKGVAPDIDLYAYRVLGAYGSGLTSWVIAGIDQAVIDEMDVINLSLGGGGNSEDDPTSVAVDNATLADVVVVSATGNAGPGEGSVSAPATSPLGIGVGNSTLPEVTQSATVQTTAGDYEKESDIELMAWTFGEDLEETLDGEFALVAIDGYGEPEDFEDVDVEGKVALISRGEIPFVDKIEAAKDAGAVAALIHNNEGEGPADVYLGDSFAWIPTFDMSTMDGEALREALAESQGTVSFSNIQADESAGNEVNESSSRGPSMPNLDVKPDVVAPGTNIMAAVPAYKKDYPDANYEQAYDRKTGTSMAAPQVAGVVALLLEKNKNLDPFDVKVALTNTAKQLDTSTYNVFAQGAGLIQPAELIKEGTRAFVEEQYVDGDGDTHTARKGSLTFGRVAPDSEEEIVLEKEITVSGDSGSYHVDIQKLPGGTGADISVDKDSFTLNGEETITATFTIDPGEDEAGNIHQGYIRITGEGTEIALPFSLELSEETPFGVTHFELQDYAISPDDPEKVHETELQFSVLHDEDQMAIELFDIQNPTGGIYGDGYIGVLAVQPITAGNWLLSVDGTYIDWLSLEMGLPFFEPIPDGVYQVDYSSWDFAQEIIHKLAGDGPFFVKRTDPEISIEVSEEKVIGEIDDAFVDYMPTIESFYEKEFDLNSYLITTYEVQDEAGEIADEGDITLEQDGTFDLPVDDLASGEYTVSITATDIALNESTEEINIEIEEPEPLELALIQTPTDETEGEVTIKVDVNKDNVTTLKWLPGERSAEDFADEGEDIDIDNPQFTVTENGTYTVYAEDEDEQVAVQTITVSNIKEKPEPLEMTLTLTPTDETEGEVTIKVDVNKDNVTTLKWLPGERSVEDFADEGEDIDRSEEHTSELQ